MLLSAIRQRLAFIITSVLFITMFLPLNILSSTALAQTNSNQCSQEKLCSFTIASHTAFAPAAGALSIQKVWTRDGKSNDKNTFADGAAIQYALYVNNSSGNSITATFHFESYWGKINAGPTQTIDHIFQNINVPVGVTGYYTPATVPTDALPGLYTDRVIVRDQNNNQNQDVGFGLFTVTGRVRLGVPFYTQYSGQDSQNFDCGPTSVAMSLSFYGKGPSGTPGDKMKAIRNVIEKDFNDGKRLDDTGVAELEDALTHYGSSSYEIAQNNTPAPDFQMMEMAVAIKQGHPVIGLINASDFGRSYTGHWLVVTGFSSDGTSNYVLLNDPDTQKARSGYPNWIVGGKISVLLSTFQSAEFDASSGPYGIVVTS